MPTSPSLYDDDIVDVRRSGHRRERFSSGSSSGSSSSSSSGSGSGSGSGDRASPHHHHHHTHSSANARLQGSVSRSIGADAVARRMVSFAVKFVVLAGFCAVCYILWNQNRELKRRIENLRGTVAVLAAEAEKAQAEKAQAVLEMQDLEREKAELNEINAALRETLSATIGGAR